ncbi:hypothetical protein [Pedobacter psychrodurus]|uniref:hypothetical protein n=1 Tax=Pedobacter psychrodurus TaxID=2530456 RepID=UPI002931A272|nr:hypothetical protein [Pedobacter psychrodurus]
MKNLIYLTLLFLCFTSCKKLTVKEEKTFYEINVPKPNGYLSSAIRVTLMVDGKADIVPGGDVSDRGTYKIKGKKLTITTVKEYEFEITSETEIKYGERILRLQ